MRRVMSPADFGLCPEAPSSVVRVGNKGRRLWFSECELYNGQRQKERQRERVNLASLRTKNLRA